MSFSIPPCAKNDGAGKTRIVVQRRKKSSSSASTLAAPSEPAPTVLRDAVPLSRVRPLLSSWVSDLRASGASTRYTDSVSDIVQKFTDWATGEQRAHFDTDAVRNFLIYVQTAHELPEGRWGEKGKTRADYEFTPGVPVARRYTPVSPNTIADYHKHLKTFGNWVVKQGFLDLSPVSRVRTPKGAKSQGDMGFRRFTVEEFEAIKKAAKQMRYAPRDYALVLFMLDTGLRASELCDLTWDDVDMVKRAARIVHGKGNKERMVHWTTETGRALWTYAAADGLDKPGAPVFIALGGPNAGGQLTRGGLRKILRQIGNKAELAHSSPHDFRRTFATFFMLSGGMQKPLMDLMGHTNVTMTNRYVRLSGANLSEMAQTHSPVAYLKKGTKSK